MIAMKPSTRAGGGAERQAAAGRRKQAAWRTAAWRAVAWRAAAWRTAAAAAAAGGRRPSPQAAAGRRRPPQAAAGRRRRPPAAGGRSCIFCVRKGCMSVKYSGATRARSLYFIPCSGPSYVISENANSWVKIATRVPPASSFRSHRRYTSKFEAQLLRTSSPCTFRVVKNHISSPKTQARVQLG